MTPQDVLSSLARPPFNLDEEALAWVRRHLQTLSTEQKLRQLFNVPAHGDDVAQVSALADLAPGASPDSAALTWTRAGVRPERCWSVARFHR